jgi:protease I
MLGAKTNAALSFEEVDPKRYDGLVIVGGAGSQIHLWNDKLLIQLVKYFNESKKVVAAICLAPIVLARSGILKGKNATYFDSPASFREMKLGGAVIVKKPVVVDGRIITADGPMASKEFSEAVVRSLTSSLL